MGLFYGYIMKINFLGLLTILFIGLKLTHYIDWDWWLILLPIYGELALILVIGILAFICVVLIELVNRVKK